MATIEHFKKWIKDDLGRWGNDTIEIVSDVDYPDDQDAVASVRAEYSIQVYTDTNRYTIRARCDEMSDYLGCFASSRKPRAGEDWTRGNDLRDGPLSLDTWRKILSDIVSYELVKIHKKKGVEGDITTESHTISTSQD